MSRQRRDMARRVPLAYVPDRPVYEEDLRQWTRRELVDGVIGGALMFGIIVTVCLLVSVLQ